MAEYVRSRVISAKLGVTMALLSLISAVNSGSAQAQTPTRERTSALSLSGIGSSIASQFLKLEVKLDNAVSQIEHKLTKTYLSAQKIDATFLKITSADQSFLKIDSANNTFLKIDNANSTFLKIDDANSQFLKLDGKAADASELGGATPQAYVRTTTGSVSVPAGTGQSTQLLRTPDGLLGVTVGGGTVGAAGPSVTIENGTSSTLPAVQDLFGVDTPVNLQPGSTPISLKSDNQSTAVMLHVQFFPVPNLFGSGAAGEAVTLILSMEFDSSANVYRFVGQLVAGSTS